MLVFTDSDFLDVYADISDYQLLEMVTDSSYLCISDTKEDVIRSEVKDM